MKKQIPPHKHSPSDIVETADDYLLPYLRSLRDPSKIDSASIEGPAPLLEGTAFPTNPFDYQLFKLTQKVGDSYIGVYQYDLSTETWTRFTATHLGSGTTNPSAGMIDGDTFYRTDLMLLYTYNGTIWTAPVTRSHDALTDVGSSDHHAVFTTTSHASVEHLAAMLNQALQPYNSNITFARKSGHEENGITYTSGEIKFQDGTARSITPAGELLGMSVGDNYIYFKTDSASLFSTTNHVDAISSGRGLLAIIIVASATDPDIPCAIQPFYAKGLNVTADTMAVTLLSAISAYLGNVEIADGRIILGDTGIIGRDAEENVRFYISTDGRAYFATGLIALDEDGMTLDPGGQIRFKSDLVGGDKMMAKMYPYYVEPGNYGWMLKAFNDGDLQFETDAAEIILKDGGTIYITGTQIYTRKMLPGQPNIDVGDRATPYDYGYFNHMHFDSTPADDHTVKGETREYTAGESLVFGDFCYLKSDGKMWKSDADAVTSMPIVVMTIESIDADATGDFLIWGIARDDSWSWTRGALLYAGTTPGTLQEAQPSGGGDQVQVVSQALETNVIKLMPCLALVEVVI